MRENLQEAQQRQKRWYDRAARETEFQPVDQVLVLLPTTERKLLARWQGPYRILWRTGKVTYLVDLHDTRKRKRTLNANPVATSYVAEETSGADNEEEDIPDW